MKTRKRIPLSIPVLGAAERDRVLRALDDGWVSSAGPDVGAFERNICEITGSPHAVATGSGTSAIHLALLVAGVRPGDVVVVPTLTFIGTVNPIVYCGARPIFADVRAADGTIDVQRVADWLAALPRRDGLPVGPDGGTVRAILPVHLYGAPADLDALTAVAVEHRVPIVEDAAEALGSTWRGRSAGTFGLLGCLSFNGNKIVTTGGGGMVLTADASAAERLRYLSTQARDDPREYTHDEIGWNYRLTNLQAALGLGQLEGFERRIARKRQLAARYRTALAGAPLRFLEPDEHASSNHWLTAVVLDDPRRRDRALADLDAAGIDARAFFQPIHRQRPYRDAQRLGDLAVAERLYAGGLNLPSSVDLDDDSVDLVCATLAESLDRPL